MNSMLNHIQEHVPFEADMAVPYSSDLPRLCSSSEFTAFAERVKREFQVSIVPNIRSLSSGGLSGSDTPPEYSFKFRCQRSNSDFLITAREMLEQFLINHNVHVYPSATSHTHKRGDSFAEAFPHFDSKVLSTAKTRMFQIPDHRIGETHFPIQDSMDMGRPDAAGERRLRLANSSPDVKALFNAPAYIYDFEEHDDSPASYVPGPSLEYWAPLAPIVRTIFNDILRPMTHLFRAPGYLIVRNMLMMPRSEAQIRFLKQN